VEGVPSAGSKKSGVYLLVALSTVKFMVDVALGAAIGALLLLFGLQFPHAAKIDSLWLVQELRSWGGPVLAEAASGFGRTWSCSGISL
jgi:hypothetical protein